MRVAYDGNGDRSPAWWPSLYGADDEIGSLNEVTPERIQRAMLLPVSGRVIELAPVIHQSMPGPIGREWRQTVLADRAVERPGGPGSDWGSFDDHTTSSAHVGCHIDGLAHLGIARRAYNGIPYEQLVARSGLRRLGAEGITPWVTRGLCLDVAAVRGVAVMKRGDVVTPADLEAACLRQGVAVEAGDVVIVNTGWMSHWDDSVVYLDGEPGIGWDAAHWLTDRRVSAVGADNWAVEVLPAEDSGRPWVVHQHLLAEMGTYLIENIRSAELVDSAASAFLFIMSPLKGRGSTGAMAAPIAVV